ncbi:ADAMTS-like protein 1 isoform X2 [Saccostrea echinata]|uniref:ADAMTS-like protein 1 isoform X2 n=1 Tax=Saccostrea echinata TaxID=191078 RepID=UPI002A7F03F9|nr:ADAMTS-like protein 1 isoform X2 [Saccostrea echinata]
MKVLSVYLGILFFLSTVTSDLWSPWSPWSTCSRTCNGGASYRTRRCIKNQHIVYGCRAEDVQYKLCNAQECILDDPDFRAVQCSSFNNQPYSGRFLKWIPYHDSTSPCALYCQAVGSNIIHRFADKVLDGTRCRNGSKDMCIDGKCWHVGCDNVLGSKIEMDNCGVCGGNNSCISPTFAKFQWKQSGFGECSSTCGVGYRRTRVVCNNRVTGKQVSNKRCMRERRPQTYTQTCQIQECGESFRYDWVYGRWSKCSCSVKFTRRARRCVKFYTNSSQTYVNETFCNTLTPEARRLCDRKFCPVWHVGHWSPCSVSCGDGVQRRGVVCQHFGREFCDLKTKPITVQSCNTTPCLVQRDLQEVVIGESDSESIKRIPPQNITDKEPRPRYMAREWQSCSVTCGRGRKWRYVKCQVYVPNTGKMSELPDEECPGLKPLTSSPCVIKDCVEQFEYRSVGMTSCSRSCLGGVQQTIIRCVNVYNGSTVDDKYCSNAKLVPIERRVCNDINCPQRWKIGDFGMCSVSCGGGIMHRDVECIQEFAARYRHVIHLPDNMCEQPIPTRNRKCNKIDCHSEWMTGAWSQCSVTCGSGYQSRDVYCIKKNAKGHYINITSDLCDSNKQPIDVQNCNQTVCPKPKLRSLDVQFFQLDKLKRVKLTIGMSAVILPGTTILIKCPTRGIQIQDIKWLKNGTFITYSGRIKLTRKRFLKIKNAIPEFDSGTYSCKAGSLQSTSSVTFSSVYDIIKATMRREKYLSGLQPLNLVARSVPTKQIDPVSRRYRPLYLVQSEWRSCSASCGGGLQSRNVSCEIITRDYYEVFPVRYCTRAGHSAPMLIQSCNTFPCVEWQRGNWSECSSKECVRDKVALQRREVSCISNGQIMNDTDHCDRLGTVPPSEKECSNSDCKAVWTASKWTRCLGECGTNGFKTRTLNCVWSKTKLHAGRHCASVKRPKTIKMCKMGSCLDRCADKSEYCSVVKIMKFCKFTNFRRNCCLSCQDS